MVDVVIFCEGTYPYVAGGVSSWIRDLMEGMPDLTFSLVYLAPTRHFDRTPKYTLPPNVEELLEVYIYETPSLAGPSGGEHRAAWESVRAFFHGVASGQVTQFRDFLDHAGGCGGLSTWDLARSRMSWEIVLDIYEQMAPDQSFVDFFWTWRFIHYPLFQLLNAEIPRARVYHTVTTGWSGFLATLATLRHGRPMLLTEHGIYSNERRIEIMKADWIRVEKAQRTQAGQEFGVLKTLWMNLFRALGDLAYHHADGIYTLNQVNRRMQIAAGADADAIRIIPNGVRRTRFEEAARDSQAARAAVAPMTAAGGTFHVGFVGRVVPIKDVHTFVKACRMVSERLPGARFYIIGPGEEDESYLREVQALVDALGLASSVIFTGPQDVRYWYPRLDVLVLTSISEGQPLVMLEAMAAGLPCVATDVGGCAELVYGADAADRALGPCGFITRVGAPQETAAAILQVAGNPALAAQMAESGRRRVRAAYEYDRMIERYRSIYLDAMAMKEDTGGRNRLQASSHH